MNKTFQYLKKDLLNFYLISVVLFASSAQLAHAKNICADLFTPSKIVNSTVGKNTDKETVSKILSQRGSDLPERSLATTKLAEFAATNGLPFKWVEFGPADRKIKRLLVAVDVTNERLMTEYRQTFNLDTSLSTQKPASTLVIEQTWESNKNPEHYIYTYIRSAAAPEKLVYRWGRADLPLSTSFDSLKENVSDKKTGLIGLGHLIEVSPDEAANVKIFLDTPDKRGPCKSSNCVAWMTGTELGKTEKTATDDERRYLFSELGISRTIAPFEISRRITHASNERHGAIAVFVDGVRGLKTFESKLLENLIPEPKVPYSTILKDYETTNPATQAIDMIKDGEKIFIPIAAGASADAVEALIQKTTQFKKGVDVHVLVNGISEKIFKKGIETTDGKFRVHALFLGGNLRQLYKEKKVSVIPGNLSDFTRTMREPGQTEFNYDTIIVRVSEPDAKGFHSLGPNHDMIMTILEARPNIKIIAEINPNVPFTKGTNKIHHDRLAATFKSTAQLAGPSTVPGNAVDTTIGYKVGELIDSGATLQIGIGNIFAAVPDGLKRTHKTDLKISTEMFGDQLMQIMKDGTATKAQAGFAFGSTGLYIWLNKNSKVTFKSTEEVNSPGLIAAVDKFHAVNTALQVDLFGQVNATMGPEGRISSVGGQVEFMTGAARSKGGKAIIAIRSTAKSETLSSIVLDLYKGPITTPNESVTHVVTEYGVAELRGRSEPQRAVALINIAHPKFRAELFQKAVEREILQESDRAKINLGDAAAGVHP